MGRTETLRSLRLTALAFALAGAPATEAVVRSGVEEDRAVLVGFQKATTAESSSWMNSIDRNREAPPGEWYGVTRNANGRVAELSLPLNNSSGSTVAGVAEEGGPTPPLALRQQDQRGENPGQPGLFLPIETGRAEREPSSESSAPFPRVSMPGITTLRNRPVRVATDQLVSARAYIEGGTPVVLSLNLFDDVVLRGILEETLPTWSGGYSLLGRLERDDGTVTLVVNGSRLSGTIRTSAGTYEIEAVDGDLHVVREVDLSGPRLRTDDVVLPSPREEREDLELAAIAADAVESGNVDVVIVYTERARRELAEEMGFDTHDARARMLTLIERSVADTNNALRDGSVRERGVPYRIRIALVDESYWYLDEVVKADQTVDYSGTLDAAVTAARNSNRELGYLRQLYSADLVHVIVGKDVPDEEGFITCGIAKRPGFVGVTGWNCLSPQLTVAHEMGHNMGLDHDPRTNETRGRIPFVSFGQGKVHLDSRGVNDSFRTIMAYGTACDEAFGAWCRQVDRFSNPWQQYRGHWLGEHEESDATRVLRSSSGSSSGIAFAARRRLYNRSCAFNLKNIFGGMETSGYANAVNGWYKCASRKRSSNGSYSTFYSFTLTEPRTLTISLESDDADTYLYLYSGAANADAAVQGSDDDGGGGLNSRLRIGLNPSTYTIEATTYRGGRNQEFILRLRTE